MNTLLTLTLLLCITFISSSTWTCAQIFQSNSAPTGNCYPPTQTNQLAGYYQTGGYSNEIYCKLNYKNAVYQLRQCAVSKCMTSSGFDSMCLCQNCKGSYYNGNAPFRAFFSTMLKSCNSGEPTVCAV